MRIPSFPPVLAVCLAVFLLAVPGLHGPWAAVEARTETGAGSVVAPGESLGAREILERAAAAMAGVARISGQFVQTRTLRILDMPLVSSGRFFFVLAEKQGEEGVLWEYLAPQRAGFLYRGGKAYYWGADGKKVPMRGNEAVFARSMAEQIHAWTAIDPQALESLYHASAAGSHAVRLVPRRTGALTAIEVTFTDGYRGLKSLRMDDQEGSTFMEFKDAVLDGPLPEELR